MKDEPSSIVRSPGRYASGHAAELRLLATRRNSALLARWTSLAASRPDTARAARSSSSKVTPGFRKTSAPGSDLSLSYRVET